MVDLRKKSTVKDAVVRIFLEDSCATLQPSFRGLAKNFSVGLDNFVKDSSGIDSIDSQVHASTVRDGITLGLSVYAPPDESETFTEVEDVVDKKYDTEVIEL